MNISSFLIYCFIVTFTPGPTNIVILSTVHNSGTAKAMKYTYGATAAFGLLLLMSAVLNTMVIPKILIFMQIIGSLYMLYLAYQIFKMGPSEPSLNRSASFKSGFLMQFLNPKVVLFTMTVLPSFVLPYYSAIAAVTISVGVITLIGFLAFITWVLSGTISKKFLRRNEKIVNILMALFLVYSVIMIWI
ncbi:LysE family translocator [Peribacillus kribbensis]|uniref:LysE family translocator n=1 Tax=Peribacillus kribbensis TaxID=356658 RepID=UPI000406D5A8|nr:LysE family transporter [Peribacillus kribbensis]